MRQEGLLRLSSLEISKNSKDYIVLQYLIADLRKAISQYARGEVLDIGCGNKPYEPLFGDGVSNYVGCDVIQSDKQKVDVICPATQLAFDAYQFDTVFSTQVIEHVDDPFKMLEEAYRVLKFDGCLILSAPFCWELHEEPYDFYRFSKYGLRAMLEKVGFEIIEIKPNGGKWAAIAQMNLNIIYSSFTSRGLIAKLLKGLFLNLRFTSLVNRLALWIDRKYYSDLLTLNYLIVAKKISH